MLESVKQPVGSFRFDCSSGISPFASCCKTKGTPRHVSLPMCASWSRIAPAWFTPSSLRLTPALMVKQLHPALAAYFLPGGTIAASAQHVLKQWLMARPLHRTELLGVRINGMEGLYRLIPTHNETTTAYTWNHSATTPTCSSAHLMYSLDQC